MKNAFFLKIKVIRNLLTENYSLFISLTKLVKYLVGQKDHSSYGKPERTFGQPSIVYSKVIKRCHTLYPPPSDHNYYVVPMAEIFLKGCFA